MADSPLSADKSAEALQGISAALSDLVALTESAHKESLQSIAAALGDVVQLLEARTKGQKPDNQGQHVAKLVDAISRLKLDPSIKFEPRFEPKFEPVINLPQQALSLEVKAPDVHNHITMDAQQPFSRMKVDFVFQGDRIVGGVITREA